MTEIFLLKIEDEQSMADIVAKYPETPAFEYIQEHILEIDVRGHSTEDGKMRLYFHDSQCASIIDGAVRSFLLVAPGDA